MSEYTHPDVLVTTNWVADHLNDPNVRLIETDEDVLPTKSDTFLGQ